MAWWKNRKTVVVYLYDPTQEDIDKIKILARQINLKREIDVKKTQIGE